MLPRMPSLPRICPLNVQWMFVMTRLHLSMTLLVSQYLEVLLLAPTALVPLILITLSPSQKAPITLVWRTTMFFPHLRTTRESLFRLHLEPTMLYRARSRTSRRFVNSMSRNPERVADTLVTQLDGTTQSHETKLMTL